jgi:hypothetical protein
MPKTVIRRRGEERVRLEVSRESLVNAIVSSAIGESVTVLQTPEVRERSLWSEETFKRPLSVSQFEKTVNYFERYVKTFPRYVSLDIFHNNIDIKRKQFVSCKSCQRESTFKVFYFNQKQCNHCKTFDSLIIETYYIYLFYINPYERITLNTKTQRVSSQHEINRGKRSIGWKSDFSGMVGRDLK